MYFRSLSLIATFACAGLTVAAPLGASDLTNLVGNTASGVSTPALPNTPALPKVARSPVDTSAVTGALPALPALPVAVPALPVDLPALPARDVDHPTLPEVFKAVVLKVNPIADKLKAAVHIKADIDAGLVLDHLHQIIDILTWAVAEVQYIVDNPVGFVLSVDGVVLALDAVAAIVATVLYVIFTTLAVVVGSVEGTLYTSCLPLVAQIGNLVARLLTLALTLVPGLLTLVVAAVGGLTESLYFLNVTAVVSVLGLPASA